jgi:maleate isomerase
LGGALGIVAMIEELEARYGKPVVSVNAATYWYALRRLGITDPMPGFGQLLLQTSVAD